MTDAAITADEALVILREVFAAPIVVALEPDAWWGRPEATLRFRFEAVEDEGWANLTRELDTGDDRARTSQWVEPVPRGLAVSRERYQAFAHGLRDAMPAIFVGLGHGPDSDDPSRSFLAHRLRDASLVTREDFARALRS
ncbi:hypothetical protein [Nannocystis punicea]|uniref:Uncharacterized protein n=1 Tax=Nannocystis punicea TaxID=2995304 RepID=A0ABY7GYM6_9BACT|nr:hypothetical protein [Nannocystis poenicansa]WAS92062.1 hypothetical protein O0S08_38260 [Nannocystis poenicansa]